MALVLAIFLATARITFGLKWENSRVDVEGSSLLQNAKKIAVVNGVGPHGNPATLRARDSMLHPKIQSFLRELEAKASTVDAAHAPQRSPLWLGQEGNQTTKGAIQFLVYSDSRFLNTRLAWVRDTWATTLSQSAIDVISDGVAADNFGMSVHDTKCPAHSHWEGACCKYAEAVIKAHELMQANQSLEWAYFSDDDAYVRPAVLEESVRQRSPLGGNNKGVILANLGCATTACTGICAGGGYAASRLAIQSLVGASPADFLREQMQSCSMCERWADIAISRVAQTRGIEFHAHEGLYGWKLPKDGFMNTLKGIPAEPLMYHYIQTKGQMDFLHGLFTGKNATSSATNLVALPESLKCATYHENTYCAASDVPWTEL